MKTIDENKLYSKVGKLDDDLSDVIIVCEYLKNCTIITSKEMTDVLANSTFETDIYKNLDESINTLHKAIELIEWLMGYTEEK